jgi:hypothetical protein
MRLMPRNKDSKLSQETIDLAVKLGSSFPDDVDKLDVNGHKARGIWSPCYVHRSECKVFLTDEQGHHVWTEDGAVFQSEPIKAYAERELRRLLPWKDIYGLRSIVSAEADLPWLWHGMLLPSAVTLFAAIPKEGKTTFIFNLLESMLRSRDFLGLATRPATILYITEESPGAIVHRIDEENYLALKYSKRVSYISAEPGLDWPTTLGHLDRALVEQPGDPLLVIVDTISFFADIQDENNASQVRQAVKPLVERARTKNLAVLLVHHSRKGHGEHGEGIRGSNAFAGLVDIVMEMQRVGGGPNFRDLNCLGRYWETPQAEPLRITWSENSGYELRPEPEDLEARIAAALQLAPKATQAELAKTAGCSQPSVSIYLKAHPR